MSISLAIHGGAGTLTPSLLTPEKEITYTKALDRALLVGKRILENGGDALDAVAAAVVELEDCPLFNAGRGSVFNASGGHEMDASIMDGRNLKAGACAAVSNIKNPVLLAQKVMTDSEHVLLVGSGAIEFAESKGISLVNTDYFFDDLRFLQFQEAKQEDSIRLDHSERKFGTVGAVACDINGNLAAATSTGGMTNKKYGRVGDTPIIGAGTYANNHTCAISCTGHGEYFLRAMVAHDISCLMEYKGLDLQEACDFVVQDKLVKLGGEGGIIGVDAKGNLVFSFNSLGMYRGAWTPQAGYYSAIYK